MSDIWRAQEYVATSILLAPLLGPYGVELLDLSDDLVVENEDILAADIGTAILLEQGQLVADEEDRVKNGLLFWVDGMAEGGRVRHGKVWMAISWWMSSCDGLGWLFGMRYDGFG